MTEHFTDEPLLTDRFERALNYALRHHARHLRKGTEIPYAAHLLAVASIVLELGGGEDEAIGALLHDVVEDGGGIDALAEITEGFGPEVAGIVEASSEWVDDGNAKPPWHQRKQGYVEGLASKSPAALRVGLADKLHNARAILLDYRVLGDDVWARFGQRQGLATRVYYRELAAAFERERERLPEAARHGVDELRRLVDEITALAEEHQGPDTRTLFSG